MSEVYFVGVDVGTGSARAALVGKHGKVYKTHVKAIQMWHPKTDHYEQSSDDVWSSICECVQVRLLSKWRICIAQMWLVAVLNFVLHVLNPGEK